MEKEPKEEFVKIFGHREPVSPNDIKKLTPKDQMTEKDFWKWNLNRLKRAKIDKKVIRKIEKLAKEIEEYKVMFNK